ncbi:hypothetical protein [Lentibacillus cibarius]|uniref:Uncharacterized protein n=1 Tax=Lentibacillus cibarius TaxID=2583219 RepID=A0A5S3QMV0_9BACI|nr:hypothetical protein [Lentibacillus cibarius]TMN21806.1 hypothetical protein FFL34_06535 [Lentibacillus cibarius]
MPQEAYLKKELKYKGWCKGGVTCEGFFLLFDFRQLPKIVNGERPFKYKICGPANEPQHETTCAPEHYAKGDVAKPLLNKEDSHPVKIKHDNTGKKVVRRRRNERRIGFIQSIQ